MSVTVINMNGHEYSLERHENDILIINKDRESVDNVYHFDKVLLNGWDDLEKEVRHNNGWIFGYAAKVEEECYEALAWFVYKEWINVCDQLPSTEINHFTLGI